VEVDVDDNGTNGGMAPEASIVEERALVAAAAAVVRDGVRFTAERWFSL